MCKNATSKTKNYIYVLIKLTIIATWLYTILHSSACYACMSRSDMKIHQKLKKDQYTTDRLAWYQRELTGTPINKPKFWVCIGLNDGKEDGRKVIKKNC